MIDSPLHSHTFRRVWIGATLSAAGDAASWVALVAYALGPAHGSVTTLAICYTAPVAIGGLVAGWALDRFDRGRLLLVDSVLRAVVFTTIPLAALWGGPSAVHLYLVCAIYGLLKMISLAGFPAMIPTLVPSDQLMAANVLETVSFGLAGLVGAIGAGLTVAIAGPAYVVAFDALSYLVFALCLLSVRTTSPVPASSRGSGLSPVVRLLWHNPVLRGTTIMFALFNIGEGALLVILPKRAHDLGLSTGGYGYLIAAMAAGELVAALVLLAGSWRMPLTGSIVVAALLAALGVAAVRIPSPWFAGMGIVVLGACAAAMTSWAQTLRMAAAPPELHGRLFGLLRTLMQATPPLGAALAFGGVPMVCALMAFPALAIARDLTRSPAPTHSA